MNISLVMIVKNEEAVLRRCLVSAAAIVDEIIIVDTGSTDNTKQIASEFGAKVYDYTWNNDFSVARNYGLEQATCDWSLVLDADEYISNDCAEAVRAFIRQTDRIGKIKRVDQFNGVHGVDYEKSYISRLFPSSCRYSGKIHEQIESNLPRQRLDVEIQHDGYMGKQKSQRNLPILLSIIEEQPTEPYYHFQIAKEYRGLEEYEQAYNHLKQAYALLTREETYAPRLIVDYLYAMISAGRLEGGLDMVIQELPYLSNYADYHFVSALFLLELIQSDPEKYVELMPNIELFYLQALEVGETEMEGSVIGAGSFAAHHNLGVFYEITGNIEKAREQYMNAAAYDYEPSRKRLSEITGS